MEVLHFVALCIASLLLADAHQLTKLGSFHLGSPAFSGFYKAPSSGGTGDKYNLIVTTFGPSLFSSIDSVQVVKDIGNHLNDIGSLVPEVVTRSVTWPNEVTDVPGKTNPHTHTSKHLQIRTRLHTHLRFNKKD